ncbi:MAG: hypothetical protein J0L86_07875 [Flavobacteriales bacterium]|nr:hypothetical protein [Flavobacteriales bacterium]
MNFTRQFIFSTNYSDPLLLENNPFPEVVKAVLLSEKYTTKSSLKKIETAKNKGSLIISDNGNFTRMSSIAKKFMTIGLELQKSAELSILNHKKITADILFNRALLINEIEEVCKNELEKINFEEIIDKQLKCNPDYLIGLEDFTIPVITMCGLMHPIFKPKRINIKEFQINTINLYLKQKDGFYGYKELLSKTIKYLVLHSYDYSSARQGAELFKDNDEEGVAISFGGPMSSRDYITRIKLKNRYQYFDTSLPEPYIIASSIIIGVNDGLSNRKLPIHILGLGSPILIILLGYLLRKNALVSIDATSTFKDADDGTIYGSKEAFLKLDMYKVAAFTLINNETYTSSSPFFIDFEEKFPSNWFQLRNELNITADSNVTDVINVLKANVVLIEKYIPYFTPMRKGNDDLIKRLRIARAGSNYYVIEKICEEIRIRRDNEEELKSWVFNELDRYKTNASKKWGMAIDAIIKIIEKYKI